MINGWFFALFLAAVYAAQCLFLVGRDSLAFSCWWGGRFRHKGPGLAFKNPYPLGLFFRVKDGDIWYDATGVYARQGTGRMLASLAVAEPFRFHAYESLEKLTQSGKGLFLDHGVFLYCASQPAARVVLGRIEALLGAPAAERPALARSFLGQRLDSGVVERGLAFFRGRVLLLRCLCQALFLDLALVLPFLFTRVFQWPAAFLSALASALALYLAIPAATFFAAKKIFVQDPGGPRHKAVAALLSPLSALRAVDLLAQEMFHDAHPLAAARVFLKEPEFEKLARQALRELRHIGINGARPAPEEMAAELEKHLAAWLEKGGLDVPKLMALPKTQGPESLAYCPCCLSQYVRREGRCKDCGVDLVPF